MSEIRVYRCYTRGVDLSENGLLHRVACWGLSFMLVGMLFLLPVAGAERFPGEPGNTLLAQMRIIFNGLEERPDGPLNRPGAHAPKNRKPKTSTVYCSGSDSSSACLGVPSGDMIQADLTAPSAIRVLISGEGGLSSALLQVSLSALPSGLVTAAKGGNGSELNQGGSYVKPSLPGIFEDAATGGCVTGALADGR